MVSGRGDVIGVSRFPVHARLGGGGRGHQIVRGKGGGGAEGASDRSVLTPITSLYLTMPIQGGRWLSASSAQEEC